jgi:hypothetical protein
VLKVSVKLDIERARRELKGLEKQVNMAAARALSRVATTVRKEADQKIRTRLSLSSATVKQALAIRKHGKRLMVDIEASGRPISLREYKATETRKGVTYRVAKAGSRKLYRRGGRPAFMIDKYGRHVFVRTGPNPPGPADAPISKVYGPSIPQYFVTRFIRERMKAIAVERWPIEFKRELQYRVNKSRGN